METPKRKSGRKPVADENKKIQICIYVEQRIIDSNGGMEKAKEKCINFLWDESVQNKIED